jgi:hypothetical protein
MATHVKNSHEPFLKQSNCLTVFVFGVRECTARILNQFWQGGWSPFLEITALHSASGFPAFGSELQQAIRRETPDNLLDFMHAMTQLESHQARCLSP